MKTTYSGRQPPDKTATKSFSCQLPKDSLIKFPHKTATCKTSLRRPLFHSPYENYIAILPLKPVTIISLK